MSEIDPQADGPRPATRPAAAQVEMVVHLLRGERGTDALSSPVWPEIDGGVLDEKTPALPAFPLDLLPLPWRGWVGDTARSVNAPADYVAQALLAGVAGLCGAGVWVRISAVWAEPLLLWLAAVGAPSSGKSPAIGPVRRLLGALERETPVAGEFPDDERRDECIFGRGPFDAIQASAHDNQRGVLLWRDEPSGCFAPLVGGRAARELDTLAVSILGSLEPDRLAPTVRRGEESLAARFLYAWPPPPPFCPLVDRQPARNDAALILLRWIRCKAGTLHHPLVLAFDEGGVAAFNDFLAELHADIRLVEGLEAAWLGKGRGVVPRLAGVLHLLDRSAVVATASTAAAGTIGRDKVERGEVERAAALWSAYFRPHAKAFFDRAAPSTLEARGRRVVRWLKACGASEVSREDVRRTALGQTVNASEADRVLVRLTEAGVLRRLTGEAGSQGGRPALRWQVNPGLRVA